MVMAILILLAIVIAIYGTIILVNFVNDDYENESHFEIFGRLTGVVCACAAAFFILENALPDDKKDTEKVAPPASHEVITACSQDITFTHNNRHFIVMRPTTNGLSTVSPSVYEYDPFEIVEPHRCQDFIVLNTEEQLEAWRIKWELAHKVRHPIFYENSRVYKPIIVGVKQ